MIHIVLQNNSVD